MSNNLQVILDEFDDAFAQLDERQRKIDNYRKVRKNDVLFQATVAKQQEELDYVRGELTRIYSKFKRLA